MESADSILQFWFGTGTDAAAVSRERSALWWGKAPKLDADIRRRFAATLESEVRGELEVRGDDARTLLARIILCDQFPRNMYRGTARAFAYDERARALAHRVLGHGADRALAPLERVFAYLPLEHSENVADQTESVRLFTALHEQAGGADKPLFRNFLDYALRHREIVERFGRFPHRNAILGRDSTPRELEFLKSPGSSF
jgi:uncharacterized protein (DUF924 family)